MKEIKIHPIAEAYPQLPAAEQSALVEDIKSNGLLLPITMFEGKILDGRHRYFACLEAEVKPRFVEFRGDDPVGFAKSVNFNRRHLTDSQRAMIAATFATMRQGERTDLEPSANLQKVSQAEAAKEYGVSPRSVATASKVRTESPKLAKAVRDNKISLNAAAQQITEAAAEEKPALDKTGLPIPHGCLLLWRRGDEVQKFLTQLSAMRGLLRKAQDEGDELWNGLSYSGALADLGRAYTSVECAKPYAVCPKCQGKLKDKCICCKGRGLISQYLWDSTITREEKSMRAKVVEKLSQP